MEACIGNDFPDLILEAGPNTDTEHLKGYSLYTERVFIRPSALQILQGKLTFVCIFRSALTTII